MIETLPRMAAIAAGTLVSEDLACVAAGLLVHAGQLGPAEGIGGCLAGIVAGDIGLWAVGRLVGRRALAWPLLARRLPGATVEKAVSWVGSRLGWAIMGARFLPGARLPVFLLAGMTGRPAAPFLFWTIAAAALWTPLLVIATALIGQEFASRFEGAAAAAPAAGLACLSALWLARGLVRWRRAGGRLRLARAMLAARVSRLWRWEFWPLWVFYIPLVPWIALLSVRYRGFSTIAAANPAMGGGGFVGESKAAILSALPPAWVLPFVRLDSGDPDGRLEELLDSMRGNGWSFPLVLKPDAGQRGAGLRLVRDGKQALACLRDQPAAVLAQVYHPGPHEAGIFYYRIPGEARGRIFSITDKVFPVLTGDGVHTVEELIWRHPRYRMQSRVFLRRLGQRALRILAPEERLRLAEAGNHCQGTMFLDGRRLHTPELEGSIDDIARSYPGFFFGRFDVRYEKEEDLKAGRGFAIVELNGVTSESTNIYDPSGSLLSAWGTLARQWSLLFRIGHRNRKAGAAPSSTIGLLRAALRHRRHPAFGHLAD